MNYTTEIILSVLAFLGGSGFYRMITMRAQRRKMSNQVAAEESSSMDEIVTRFNNRIADLSERYTKVIERNMELEETIAQLEREKKGNQ